SSAVPSKMSPLMAVVALHIRLIKTNSLIAINKFVNKPVVKNCKAKSSEEELKAVRKNDDALIIEE
nr:hypothetical protein [Tanacetum cinerariifolium]